MIQISPEDLELFKKHFHFYESWKKSACIYNYGKQEYNDMVYLYTKYVDAKQVFNHWCSSCRIELVEYLYRWFVNETHTTWYKEDQPVEEAPAIIEEPVIENKPIKRRRKK